MNEEIIQDTARPWVSFCMSTYKRPEFLRKQLTSLLEQTFGDFEIVVSDNDPDGTAERIIKEINDARVKSFHNGTNIGMIGSFNKSIERSKGEFIVMVTDDDPVMPNFLAEMKTLEDQDDRYAIYGGFQFSGVKDGEKVIVPAERFIQVILNPSKTTWMLWSSCMIRREKLLIRKIPEYGSPHLADHAMIALAGSYGGGLILNKKFSSLTSHDANFSKFNFNYYVNGCEGFYNAFNTGDYSAANKKVVRKHLYHWFIANMSSLKRYYTVAQPDEKMLHEVDRCAEQILDFGFMKGVIPRYKLKMLIFTIKRTLGVLKAGK
jgi:glycosyltransferase involved in cell wall biosynthesis